MIDLCFICFKNYFLIVMLIMSDFNFVYFIIYICEYNDEGVMGIVVNWLMDLMVGDILFYLKIDEYD